MGSMPLLISEIKNRFDFSPGDIIIANDPFSGGTHLPDITLTEPVFLKDRLWGWAAVRAHHSDVGGVLPGSMPDSTSIYQEGLIIPPIFLRKKYVLNESLMEMIVTNTRTPDIRKGDLMAQMASLAVAAERIEWMIRKYGFEESLELTNSLINYSEKMTVKALSALPEGTADAVDYLEDDKTGRNVPIKVNITIKDGIAVVDFTGTAPACESNFNAPLPVTYASVYYVFRSLLGDHIPANAGCFKPIKIITIPGSLVDAKSPSAVSAGNVETSQRIVDVLLLALSKLLPGVIPAASCGTMNNVAIGGSDSATGRSFTYYETIGGGAGAGPLSDGLSAVQTHMTNTRNTPVEALETTYPLRITKYSIREDSGGQGKHKGGNGIIREYEFLSPCQVSLTGERRHNRPYGLEGGLPGKAGQNIYFNVKKQEKIILPGKTTINVSSGDRLTIMTPGGGGFGIRG